MKVDSIIKIRNIYGLRRIVQKILLFLGVDLPYKVNLGKNVKFPHNSIGTVIHPNTKIGNEVKIYQNVTIGRADIYNSFEQSEMKRIEIEDGVIICAGAKILSNKDVLKIGRNSIVAANSVLLTSIGENEIWGGIPAKKIGIRTDL